MGTGSRVALTALVVALAIWAAVVVCLRPLECDRIEAVAQRETLSVMNNDMPEYLAKRQARRNLSVMDRCLRTCADAGILMVAAANERLLGNTRDAIADYERALHYDRRPEIYLQLGLTQLSANRRQEAIENIATAAKFTPDVMRYVGYAEIWDDVNARLQDFETAARKSARR